MKLLYSIFFFFALSISVSSAQKIEFDALEINYGDIEQGADTRREFKFTNNSDMPLVIESAFPSIDFLVVEYSREPIMPHQSSAIKIKYKTYYTGRFVKYITVKSSCIDKPKIRLCVRGEVHAPAVPAAEK